MGRDRISIADLRTAVNGTMHGRFRDAIVTIHKDDNDTWLATAWPDDGRASMGETAKRPEDALEALLDRLEARI